MTSTGKASKARRQVLSRRPSLTQNKREMGEPAAHERDAIAFWFRRLATTLALGNGAGVLALSGYITNSKHVEAAAIVGYPSLSFFLSGALLSFTSFVLSLIWASFRIEAYTEYFDRLSKLKHVFDKDQNQLKNAVTIIGVIVFLGQVFAIGSSGWFFYSGCYAIVEGLRNIACVSSSDRAYCDRSASPLFPRSYDESLGKSISGSLSDDSNSNVASKAVNSGFIFYIKPNDEFNKAHRSMFLPQYIVINPPSSASNSIIKYSKQVVRVQIVPDVGNIYTCKFSIGDFYVGDGSPLVTNPHAYKFLSRDGTKARNGGNVIMSFAEAEITIEYSIGTERSIKTFYVYPQEQINVREELSIPENSGDVAALTYSSSSGGLFVSGRKDQPLQGDCAAITKLLMLSSR
jgi:hypothetical protein